MSAIIVFDKETTLLIDETQEQVLHELSEARRGGRFALVHQAELPHHVNPAAVAYVTEAASGSDPTTEP